mmetsp:Transcript_18055/g.32338  ORF Transcript_18055/g.32338 Transcript_18055/m.32338 type:complete len:533 (+) Transcript_18055:66-1664(+)
MSKEYVPPALTAESKLDGEVVASASGGLYLFNGEGKKFETKVKAGTMHVAKLKGFKTIMSIWNQAIPGTPLMKLEIQHSLNIIKAPADQAIQWNLNYGGKLTLWSFKFEDSKEMDECVRKMRIAMWERERKEDFIELKQEDQTAVADTEDMEYDTEDEEDEDEIYEMRERYHSDYRKKEAATPSKNSYVEVGKANNRSFVVRGSEIGVFKNDNKSHGGLGYVSKISEVRDTKGNLFSPEKAFLHDRDRKMILLPQGERQKALLMDLETEKVVEEWRGPEDFLIKDLIPGRKYQQMTAEQLVAGVNKNTVFRLDPRINGKNKIADHRIYKSNYKFGCITANDTGHLAVGSEKGEIRLYSEASKIAKCAFPGLGDLIKGIDTTADGKWVLGTCKNYLLLYCVVKPNGKTGFETRMLKDEKPIPFKLQLSPSDIMRYGIEEVDFTVARFDLGEDEEQMISTSTGQFVIVWSFSAIKKKGVKARYEYRIKKMDCAIVGEQFQYNSAKMVVGYEDDVVVQTMEKAKAKPRREKYLYK